MVSTAKRLGEDWLFSGAFVVFCRVSAIFRIFCLVILRYFVYLQAELQYVMKKKDTMIAAEPAAALLSEDVRKSGLLAQVMKLSQSDKVALVKYLNKDMERETPFDSDEFGRIKLSSEMKAAALRAERDFETGKCFSEADFKERFVKWL